MNQARQPGFVLRGMQLEKEGSRIRGFSAELYREGSLSRKELGGRVRAVQALAAGKLRPQVFDGEDAGSERSGLQREEVVGGEKRGPA